MGKGNKKKPQGAQQTLHKFLGKSSSEDELSQEDLSFHLSDVEDKNVPEYWTRVSARGGMRSLQPQVWNIHDDLKLWRDSNRRKSAAPVNFLPFLFDPDTLNGNHTDWSLAKWEPT